MHPSVEQLLKVQEVDSQSVFLNEAMRLRPQELADEQKKVAVAQAVADGISAEITQLRKEFDQRELEIKNCDAQIEKLTITLNIAKTNQEYSVLRDQIERQKESRGHSAATTNSSTLSAPRFAELFAASCSKKICE